VTIAIDNRSSAFPEIASPPSAPAQHLPPRPLRRAEPAAALIALQDEYRAWLDNIPNNLEGSKLADRLQAVAKLDLEELQTIEPRRGYGHG